jgi:hypothetical protein
LNFKQKKWKNKYANKEGILYIVASVCRMYRMVATTDGERDAQPCEQFAATDKGERAHIALL